MYRVLDEELESKWSLIRFVWQWKVNRPLESRTVIIYNISHLFWDVGQESACSFLSHVDLVLFDPKGLFDKENKSSALLEETRCLLWCSLYPGCQLFQANQSLLSKQKIDLTSVLFSERRFHLSEPKHAQGKPPVFCYVIHTSAGLIQKMGH